MAGELAAETFQVLGRLPEELYPFLESIGESRFRAEQIFQGLYKHRYRSWDEFTNLPAKLRKFLSEIAPLGRMPVRLHKVSEDGTQKFAFQVEPGKEVEAVWIPKGGRERKTICISSQVGCTLNCKFCATAKMDFRGNLKTWQILEQVRIVEREVGDNATNIVFMGMGEPLHNYFEVIRAARILHHPNAWNLGAKRITISTAGVVPRIHRFIDSREPFNFAISLNQPDPKARSEIMDINERHSLQELLDAAERFVRELDRTITFEYVMIPGVNMSDHHIRLLAKIAGRIGKCKFNVIPLNTKFFGWKAPTEEEVIQFVKKLKIASKVPVMNRRSPGKEIGGACGMLALAGK